MIVKELEDYDWFPAVLRRFQTEFIGSMVAWTHIYRPIAPLLDAMMQKNNTRKMADLCSGSAHPVLYLTQFWENAVQIHLTDKFPTEPVLPESTPHQFIVERTSYDVLSASFSKDTIYTMFNAFHHFDHQEQVYILEQFQKAQAPFLIVEILQPNLFEIVKIAVTTTIGQLFTAPFIAPFSWQRLLFTYILPVNLLTVTVDGVISVTKSKTAKAYRQLANAIPTTEYSIEATQIRTRFFTTLTIIQGTPKHVTST
jgi:hypothetical protein